MEHAKLPGNERNWELHPACSAKLLHLMCFSFQWLCVLCPSCTHFSWVPVCNIRAIWKIADNANNKPLPQQNSELFLTCRARTPRIYTDLRLMQGTPRGVPWQYHYTYHEKTMGSSLWKRYYHIQGTCWIHHWVTRLWPNSQSCHTPTST